MWPENSGITYRTEFDHTVFHFSTAPDRRSIEWDGITVHIISRNDAYNYWVVDTHSSAPIVRAGYLVRTARMEQDTLHLTGDINATTTLEIIGSPLFTALTFNTSPIPFHTITAGIRTSTLQFHVPDFSLPNLSNLQWRSLQTALPEILPSYNDSLWPEASLKATNNTSLRNLTTPTSLYSSDYGFHCGMLLYRGSFLSRPESPAPTSIYLETQGGVAFAHSIWLNRIFLGSWQGSASAASYNATYPIPADVIRPAPGTENLLTILIDHMGLEQNHDLGADYPSTMKTPRGILDYSLQGYAKEDITWRLTGNFGGDTHYPDQSRGPLNEGGMFAERRGFHLPGADTSSDDHEHPWRTTSAPELLPRKPGLAFHTTRFELDMPEGYDIPLSFSFPPISSANATDRAYRALLFVNGWQFGRYLSHIGPQTRFPVPEGILNYRGENFLAVALWSLSSEIEEAVVGEAEGLISLEAGMVVQSGYGGHLEGGRVEMSPGVGWREREGVY